VNAGLARQRFEAPSSLGTSAVRYRAKAPASYRRVTCCALRVSSSGSVLMVYFDQSRLVGTMGVDLLLSLPFQLMVEW